MRAPAEEMAERAQSERLDQFHADVIAACIPYWHLGAITRTEFLERIDAIAVPREHRGAV